MFHLFRRKSHSIQILFNEWVDSMEINDKQDLAAINFGIFETNNGFKVYLIGSNFYEVENDDWATNEDYVPKQKYLKQELLGINDWRQAQAKVVELIKNYLSTPNGSKSILSKVKHITCGFDDGELEIVRTKDS